jgi:hypothetical protein
MARPQSAYPHSERPPLRSPLASALGCFALAGGLLAASATSGWGADSLAALLLLTAACVAALGGTLALARSTAIRRIASLRRRNNRLADELAQLTLCSEQIGSTLVAVNEFRGDPGGDPLRLVEGVMQAADTRAVAAFDSSVRIYLVQTTAHAHVVRAVAGIERFGIEVGKSCPADRPLEDVLPRLGRYWSTAPMSVAGARHTLVLLSDEPPAHANRDFVDQLALALSLADQKALAQTPKPLERAGRLRAV